MRDLLFRGKRKDNGEWVTGYYFERKDTKGNIIESVIIEDAYEQITNGQRYMRSNLNYECFWVDPETVGQYVGYADKNGKKIFEGDILQKDNEMRYVYYYPPFAMYMLSKVPTGGATNGMYLQIFECEVIGNIYDNPDLLEVDHG